VWTLGRRPQWPSGARPGATAGRSCRVRSPPKPPSPSPSPPSSRVTRSTLHFDHSGLLSSAAPRTRPRLPCRRGRRPSPRRALPRRPRVRVRRGRTASLPPTTRPPRVESRRPREHRQQYRGRRHEAPRPVPSRRVLQPPARHVARSPGARRSPFLAAAGAAPRARGLEVTVPLTGLPRDRRPCVVVHAAGGRTARFDRRFARPAVVPSRWRARARRPAAAAAAAPAADVDSPIAARLRTWASTPGPCAVSLHRRDKDPSRQSGSTAAATPSTARQANRRRRLTMLRAAVDQDA